MTWLFKIVNLGLYAKSYFSTKNYITSDQESKRGLGNLGKSLGDLEKKEDWSNKIFKEDSQRMEEDFVIDSCIL